MYLFRLLLILFVTLFRTGDSAVSEYEFFPEAIEYDVEEAAAQGQTGAQAPGTAQDGSTGSLIQGEPGEGTVQPDNAGSQIGREEPGAGQAISGGNTGSSGADGKESIGTGTSESGSSGEETQGGQSGGSVSPEGQPGGAETPESQSGSQPESQSAEEQEYHGSLMGEPDMDF